MQQCAHDCCCCSSYCLCCVCFHTVQIYEINSFDFWTNLDANRTNSAQFWSNPLTFFHTLYNPMCAYTGTWLDHFVCICTYASGAAAAVQMSIYFVCNFAFNKFSFISRFDNITTTATVVSLKCTTRRISTRKFEGNYNLSPCKNQLFSTVTWRECLAFEK